MVTRWSREKHIEMAYSYVGTDGCGEDYDSMEKTVDNKVYFAGEVSISHISTLS